MPGWSNYKKYVNECEYDLTDGVKENNEISVIVADGWYAGNLGYNVGNAVYGKEKRLRAEIAIEYENAEKQTIETDETSSAFTLLKLRLASSHPSPTVQSAIPSSESNS